MCPRGGVDGPAIWGVDEPAIGFLRTDPMGLKIRIRAQWDWDWD